MKEGAPINKEHLNTTDQKLEILQQTENKKNPEELTISEALNYLAAKPGQKIDYIGTATSDFQSHPLLYDDKNHPIILSDWEMETQKSLGDNASKKKTIKRRHDKNELPHFFDQPEKYINRAAEINNNMFRISLDFARLCPKPGEFDTEMMDKYIKVLALARARNLEPMLAMYHWPMPKYLLKINENNDITAGGWENPEVNKHFRYYIEQVVNYLGNRDRLRKPLEDIGMDAKSQEKFLNEGLVKYFLTINEPFNLILPTYIAGVFPPFKKGRVDKIGKILERLVEAHDIARDQLKSGELTKDNREIKVGAGHNWIYFDGVLGDLFHKIANKNISSKFERDNEYSDFIGLQYYFHMTTPLIQKYRKGRDYSDNPYFGDVYPPGIYKLLKKMNKDYPHKDIFITEFGFSDQNDKKRPYWILETVRYILEAVKHNIPVKGMLLWTLINNFEWSEGMDQKFGLFSEDQLNQPLIPSQNGVRSWEVWKAISEAITTYDPEKIKKLQKIYEQAKNQYEEYIYKNK